VCSSDLGDGSFKAPVSFLLPMAPFSIVSGDFDGDGIPDLAVDGSNNLASVPRLAILLGNGDGTFRSGTLITNVPQGNMAVGDFNRDGKADLAVGFAILYGNGDGTFQPLV